MRVPTPEEYSRLNARPLEASRARTQINLPNQAFGAVGDTSRIESGLGQLSQAAGAKAKKMQKQEQDILRAEFTRSLNRAETEFHKATAGLKGAEREGIVEKREAIYEDLRNSEQFQKLLENDEAWGETTLSNARSDGVVNSVNFYQQGLNQQQLASAQGISADFAEDVKDITRADFEDGSAQTRAAENADAKRQAHVLQYGESPHADRVYSDAFEKGLRLGATNAVTNGINGASSTEDYDEVLGFLEANMEVLGESEYNRLNQLAMDSKDSHLQTLVVSEFADGGDYRESENFILQTRKGQLLTVSTLATAGGNSLASSQLGISMRVTSVAASGHSRTVMNEMAVEGFPEEMHPFIIASLDAAIAHKNEGSARSAKSSVDRLGVLFHKSLDGDPNRIREAHLEAAETTSDPNERYEHLMKAADISKQLGEEESAQNEALFNQAREDALSLARGDPDFTRGIRTAITYGDGIWKGLPREEREDFLKRLDSQEQRWADELDYPTKRNNDLLLILAKSATDQHVGISERNVYRGAGNEYFNVGQHMRARMEGSYEDPGAPSFEMAAFDRAVFAHFSDDDLEGMTTSRLLELTRNLRGKYAREAFGRYLLANRAATWNTELSQEDNYMVKSLTARVVDAADARQTIAQAGSDPSLNAERDRDIAFIESKVRRLIQLRNFTGEGPVRDEEMDGLALEIADFSSVRRVTWEGKPVKVFSMTKDKISEDLSADASAIPIWVHVEAEALGNEYGLVFESRESYRHLAALIKITATNSGASNPVRVAAADRMKWFLEEGAKLTKERIDSAQFSQQMSIERENERTRREVQNAGRGAGRFSK